MQTITMRIPKTGLAEGTRKVQIATSGFQGSECQAATADLERQLGTVESDTPTDEMHATTDEHLSTEQ